MQKLRLKSSSTNFIFIKRLSPLMPLFKQNPPLPEEGEQNRGVEAQSPTSAVSPKLLSLQEDYFGPSVRPWTGPRVSLLLSSREGACMFDNPPSSWTTPKTRKYRLNHTSYPHAVTLYKGRTPPGLFDPGHDAAHLPVQCTRKPANRFKYFYPAPVTGGCSSSRLAVLLKSNHPPPGGAGGWK